MSDKEQSYIYNVEFTIENIELHDFPPELECPDDLDFLVRFQMNNDVCLEVTEDEYIHSINCNEKTMKNIIFSMSNCQLECDPKACITGYKIVCPKKVVSCGCYNVPKLHCKLKELKTKYDCNCSKTPTSQMIKELATLTGCDGNVTGSIHFILRLTCYGPQMNCNMNRKDEIFSTEYDKFERIKGCIGKTEKAENECIQTRPNDEYDEYLAQLNGNSLIVRVTKDAFVTRVYDSSCSDDKDRLTVRGCDQQIDFKFPKNFTCCQCKKKFGNCNCRGDSDLTDYQRKTSCSGSSYKNSQVLPVIRGNLKYPGRFENQVVNFDIQDHCTPSHATEKYKMRPQNTRAVCQQTVNYDSNLNPPKGIEVCRIGCEDDVDVFVWKICQKRTSKNGKKNEIELEMRTPRGPKVDIPKRETREVQVIESEFEEIKKISNKKEVDSSNAVLNGTEGIQNKAKLSSLKSSNKNGNNSKKPPASKVEEPSKKKTIINNKNSCSLKR